VLLIVVIMLNFGVDVITGRKKAGWTK
jgi:hypothetical protein